MAGNYRSDTKNHVSQPPFPGFSIPRTFRHRPFEHVQATNPSRSVTPHQHHSCTSTATSGIQSEIAFIIEIFRTSGETKFKCQGALIGRSGLLNAVQRMCRSTNHPVMITPPCFRLQPTDCDACPLFVDEERTTSKKHAIIQSSNQLLKPKWVSDHASTSNSDLLQRGRHANPIPQRLSLLMNYVEYCTVSY